MSHVLQVSIQKRSLYQELLSNVSILKSMTQTELLNLADALQPEDFKQGEYLIKFREPGEYMFIILTGMRWGVHGDAQGAPSFAVQCVQRCTHVQ